MIDIHIDAENTLRNFQRYDPRWIFLILVEIKIAIVVIERLHNRTLCYKEH